MHRPVDARISQGFGENPTSKILPGSPDYWIIEQFGNYQPDGHTGEDYSVPVGTPIKAVTSGTVLHAGWYGGSYLDNGFWIAPNFAGYCYVINHDPAPGFPNGFIGVYAHGRDGGTKVKAGQRVTEGQVIGLSGNTGGSTGPHLHFEILPDKFVVNGYMYGRVNPENLFSNAAIAPQGTTIKPIPKEWDEMASKQDIKDAINEELRAPRSQQLIKDAFYGEIGARRTVSRLQSAIWTQVGGTRSGKLVSMWRDMVDTNTILRSVLAGVQDLTKRSGTNVASLDADAVVDALSERLANGAKGGE